MTKEELFKENYPEYVTEKGDFLSPYWDLFSAGIECATYELNKGCMQTLTKEIAELEAKTQWHDLRKNPDDLPKENTLVFSDRGMIVMWRGFSWAEYSPNYDNIKLKKWEEPVAWCELPKFEE